MWVLISLSSPKIFPKFAKNSSIMETVTAVSIEEYFSLLHDSEEKLEYYDGEIVAMSGAQPNHNIVACNLIAEFVVCLKKQGCIVLNSDQLITIGKDRLYVFPDIVVVCDKPLYERTKRGLKSLLNPKIVVEVLSDSTETHDRSNKLEYYQTLASLENYVLVATRKKKVEVYRKSDRDEWLHRLYNEGNPMMKIGECEIDLREIYANVDFEKA